MELFSTKVKFDKINEDGVQKTVTEQYIVQAYSWTEAENTITREMEPFISGEFSISDISRYKVSDALLDRSGDRYYKVKIDLLTLDEKSGKEKRQGLYILVLAKDINDARMAVVDDMNKGVADYVVSKIEETAVIDVFI